MKLTEKILFISVMSILLVAIIVFSNMAGYERGKQPNDETFYRMLYEANQKRLADIFYIVNMWKYTDWDRDYMINTINGIMNDTTYVRFEEKP